jgi:hypothetical protein
MRKCGGHHFSFWTQGILGISERWEEACLYESEEDTDEEWLFTSHQKVFISSFLGTV